MAQSFPLTFHPEMLTHYRALCKWIEPKLMTIIRTLPRTPFAVEETPKEIAESFPAAYYFAPPTSLDRPGMFYVNTSKIHTRPRYDTEAYGTLSLHFPQGFSP